MRGTLIRRIMTKLSELNSGGGVVRRTTAGIIVIGDEILKGSTQDVNSNFMCQRLHSCGVIVRKISVVSDEIDDIAVEVKDFSDKFDIVFTTGGIGPTHDDRTFAGIAKAFNDRLVLNEELKRIVYQFLRKSKISDVDEAVEKFCKIPSSAKLIWDTDTTDSSTTSKSNENSEREISFASTNNKFSCRGEEEKKTEKDPIQFPSFQVRNVISLPGVPSFCERNFEYLQNYLFSSINPFFSRTLFLQRSEIHLERKLTQIAGDHSDKGVTIGSYPIMDNNYFKTKLIVESDSHDNGTEAHDQLSDAFKDYLVSYDETPWTNSMEKLVAYREKQSADFQIKIDEALNTIDEVLKDYTLDQISLSFNGGKDCTILLHLFRCCVDRRFGENTTINGFQILNDDEFSEVCDFVHDISKSYKLKMTQVNASLKSGLAHLKLQHSNIVAVLMGSRRTDPNGKFMKSKCEWTDSDWPHFYRVCPILDWSYSDVWRALRGLCVPYCRIYDRGYTSLGNRSSTHPNPALMTIDEHGRKRYLPAYRLEDEQLERCSRENRSQSLNEESL